MASTKAPDSNLHQGTNDVETTTTTRGDVSYAALEEAHPSSYRVRMSI